MRRRQADRHGFSPTLLLEMATARWAGRLRSLALLAAGLMGLGALLTLLGFWAGKRAGREEAKAAVAVQVAQPQPPTTGMPAIPLPSRLALMPPPLLTLTPEPAPELEPSPSPLPPPRSQPSRAMRTRFAQPKSRTAASPAPSHRDVLDWSEIE